MPEDPSNFACRDRLPGRRSLPVCAVQGVRACCQRYPKRMNHPGEITPEHAQRLVTLLGMMSDLGHEDLGFLVGHMASRDIDLAIEAYGALMATQLPPEHW